MSISLQGVQLVLNLLSLIYTYACIYIRVCVCLYVYICVYMYICLYIYNFLNNLVCSVSCFKAQNGKLTELFRFGSLLLIRIDFG